MMESVYFRAWVDETIKQLDSAVTRIDNPKQAPKRKPKADIRSDAYVLGVYLLESEGKIVYVGQSRNVYARIAQHMAAGAIEFDSFSIKRCTAARLSTLEAQLIREHMPIHNRILPAHGESKYEMRPRHEANL